MREVWAPVGRATDRVALLSTLAASSAIGQTVRLEFDTMSRDIIQARLNAVARKAEHRKENLRALFGTAGCNGGSLTEQKVKRSRVPNVICTAAGSSESTIIVGAHFDHVDAGMGAVGNWSGAALLPSLYQSLTGHPRRHKFLDVFLD